MRFRKFEITYIQNAVIELNMAIRHSSFEVRYYLIYFINPANNQSAINSRLRTKTSRC